LERKDSEHLKGVQGVRELGVGRGGFVGPGSWSKMAEFPFKLGASEGVWAYLLAVEKSAGGLWAKHSDLR